MAGPFIELDQFYEVSGYVKMIGSRLASLQGDVDAIEKTLQAIAARAASDRKSMRASVDDIKRQVLVLKEGVKEIQKIMMLMIGELKNTLKSTDFDKFEKRLDMWGPESLVTRREAQRIVLKD